MRTGSLLLWCALGAVVVGLGGSWSDPYREAVRDNPGPVAYPLGDVLEVVGIVGVQALVLVAVLRPWSYLRSWGRALVAALLSAGQWVVFAMAQMHSPPFMFAHFLWLTATVSVLGGLTLLSIGAAMRAWWTADPKPKEA